MPFLLLLVALLCLPVVAECRQFAQWGTASSHPAGSDRLSEVKWAEFGTSGDYGKLAYTVGVGAWNDCTKYKVKSESRSQEAARTMGGISSKARGSMFVESLFGVEPKSEHFYIGYKIGPALITHPDCLLGSNLQIAHELGIGMLDMRGVRVGLVIKHFSNAGLVSPNVGRDFWGLRIEW